jgi:transcriptional regulator with XRE-family HTH domain
MTANERIKQVRTALKMAQKDFAQAIYVSNSYVAELENGHRPLNGRIISLISLTFGVSEEWLKSGAGPMFDKTPERKLDRITELFGELNPHFQNFVLSQVEQLIATQKLMDAEKEPPFDNTTSFPV